MLSVGLLGATGYMGSALCSGLLPAFRKRQLSLVILHHPSSDTARYPTDVEKRPLDLERGDLPSLREALQGLQIVISAISHRAPRASQYTLLEALRDSAELITFFPTEYATPYRTEDLQSPFLGGTHEKAKVVARAKELGVPVTVVKNATTPELLFGMPEFSAFDPKANRLQLYHPLGDGKRGLTSKEFSGAALVHLLLTRLHDIPNHTFSFVELDFSSEDLTTAFTELHSGAAPEIVEYTEEDYQRDLKASFMGAMRAARMKGLAKGVEWPGEKVQGFVGWKEKSVEEWVKEFM